MKIYDKKLAYPYFVWMVLFTVVPLFIVVYYAFTDAAGNFTMDNLLSVSGYGSVFARSLLLALIATVICLVIAFPVGYFLSRLRVNKQHIMLMLVMLPMWMNFLIRTYSWMTILGDSGVINSFLTAVGLEPAKLINNGGAVILGMVYNFLPYMILPIYSVLSKLDGSLIEAAEDLGSSRHQVFRRVVLPMSLPGVLSGITMVFVPCVSTFYITQKLGGGQVVLVGDVIETQFQSANNYNLGAALSLVLMVLILICLGVMNHFGADDSSDGGVIV